MKGKRTEHSSNIICSRESLPDKIEHVEKAEPAAVDGPWPLSYLHGRSEQGDL